MKADYVRDLLRRGWNPDIVEREAEELMERDRSRRRDGYAFDNDGTPQPVELATRLNETGERYDMAKIELVSAARIANNPGWFQNFLPTVSTDKIVVVIANGKAEYDQISYLLPQVHIEVIIGEEEGRILDPQPDQILDISQDSVERLLAELAELESINLQDAYLTNNLIDQQLAELIQSGA